MEENQFKLDLNFAERPENRLFDWLYRYAYGLVNAKKADVIQHFLGWTPRQIAEIKSNAVISFHYQIGSTTTDGYFIPIGEDEQEIGGRELKAKAIRILVQYAAYKRITEAQAVKEITEDLLQGVKE